MANQAGCVDRDHAPVMFMLDRMELTIAINLETAVTIGFHFPLDVLVVADEIFEHTVRPDARRALDHAGSALFRFRLGIGILAVVVLVLTLGFNGKLCP